MKTTADAPAFVTYRHLSRQRPPLAMTAFPRLGNVDESGAVKSVSSTNFGALMSGQSDKLPAHVRAFSELLIKLRRELGNDLDLVLIMAVIAERHYARATQPDASDSAIRASTGTQKIPGINTHSVALYAEIPRETVRRKVAKLVDRGWVQCDGQGNLTPAPQAASDLARGTTATLKYLGEITQDR